MNYTSIFDVIGPNMIGPSSSHTAGAVSIALMARKLFQEEIVKVEFTLYGSFAKTYRGHGTDRALLGGILGFAPDDVRIREAFRIAEERGLEFRFMEDHDTHGLHPNTADIVMHNGKGRTQFVRGVSVGGGRMKIVKINNIDVDFTGEYSAAIVIHQDKPGVVAHITKCLSDDGVNIAFMRLFREAKGHIAYTIVESDDALPADLSDMLKENPNVHDVMIVQK